MPGFYIPDSTKACLDDHAFKGVSAYDGPDPNMEYARNNRWLIEFLEPFGNIKDGILVYAHKCARPTPELDEIRIHSGQDEIYRPGKNRWNPIDFTFYEKSPTSAEGTTADEAAKRIYEWWSNSTLILRQSKHGSIANYLKTAHLQMLDGIGKSIWQYSLYQCWPVKVSPSDLDYADGNIAEITVTLRFSKAKEGPGK